MPVAPAAAAAAKATRAFVVFRVLVFENVFFLVETDVRFPLAPPPPPSFGGPRTPRTLERRAPLQCRDSGVDSALQGAEARGRRVEVCVEEYSIFWAWQEPFIQGDERARP